MKQERAVCLRLWGKPAQKRHRREALAKFGRISEKLLIQVGRRFMGSWPFNSTGPFFQGPLLAVF